MSTLQDLEPRFPILNNCNILVVSLLLRCTVCPVCGLLAVKLVKYEVANYMPVPVGKYNPTSDFPKGILYTFSCRISRHREWWGSCCSKDLNPICVPATHRSVWIIHLGRDGTKPEVLLNCSVCGSKCIITSSRGLTVDIHDNFTASRKDCLSPLREHSARERIHLIGKIFNSI